MLTRIASRCYSSMSGNAGRLTSSSATLLSNRMNKQVEFNFKQYIDERSPDFYIAGLKRWETQLATARAAAADADTVIEPIDWKLWESEIEDKQAVRQIREEYENMEFPKPEGVDVSEQEQKSRKKMVQWDKYIKMLEEDIPELEEQLEIAKQDLIEEPYYTYWDWMRRFPGAQEQFAQEYDEGFMTVQPSAWEWANDNPCGKARELERTGGFIPLGPPTLPFVFGDYDAYAEYQKALETEKELFGEFENFEEDLKYITENWDPWPAYMKARDDIDSEVKHFSAYVPEGGHH